MTIDILIFQGAVQQLYSIQCSSQSISLSSLVQTQCLSVPGPLDEVACSALVDLETARDLALADVSVCVCVCECECVLDTISLFFFTSQQVDDPDNIALPIKGVS